jgi:hypothetical protein
VRFRAAFQGGREKLARPAADIDDLRELAQVRHGLRDGQPSRRAEQVTQTVSLDHSRAVDSSVQPTSAAAALCDADMATSPITETVSGILHARHRGVK